MNYYKQTNKKPQNTCVKGLYLMPSITKEIEMTRTGTFILGQNPQAAGPSQGLPY